LKSGDAGLQVLLSAGWRVINSPFEGIAVKLRSLKKVFEGGTIKANGF
jgi:hypothetical protein